MSKAFSVTDRDGVRKFAPSLIEAPTLLGRPGALRGVHV